MRKPVRPQIAHLWSNRFPQLDQLSRRTLPPGALKIEFQRDLYKSRSVSRPRTCDLQEAPAVRRVVLPHAIELQPFQRADVERIGAPREEAVGQSHAEEIAWQRLRAGHAVAGDERV